MRLLHKVAGYVSCRARQNVGTEVGDHVEPMRWWEFNINL